MERSAQIKISIVVSTYGREEQLKRLVESGRREFNQINLEFVVVASDSEGSSKCKWAREQSDVNLICLGDREQGSPRKKSLYFYENLGIRSATGSWILITNDDTEFVPGTEEAFLSQANRFDVLVAPTEIGDSSLGKRAPVIGQVSIGQESKEIYLLDFAFFRKEVLNRIGEADEKLDWYGGGADRAFAISLHSDFRVGVLEKGGLTHFLELENREPPHSIPDFVYLHKKWQDFESRNPHVKFKMNDRTSRRYLPMAWYSKVWPRIQRIKRAILG